MYQTRRSVVRLRDNQLCPDGLAEKCGDTGVALLVRWPFSYRGIEYLQYVHTYSCM